MVGAWLRQGEYTKCAYRVSSQGTIRISVQVSDVASAYLLTKAEVHNYEQRRPCKATAGSEHNFLTHTVEGRGLEPLDEMYLVVANRSAGRIEVIHRRQTVKELD